MLTSLAINSCQNAPFIPAGALGLPAEVDTAACLAVMDDELRVLINRHGNGETLQYRLSSTRQIEPLPNIPMTVADVAACQGSLYVSGSNHTGTPVIGHLDSDGRMIGRFSLDALFPTRWPAPLCASSPMLVWQTNTHQIEIADISQQQLIGKTSHEVGEFPVVISDDEQAIWIASTDSSGIIIDKLVGVSKKTTRIATPHPSEISMSCYRDAIRLVWNHGHASFTASINKKELSSTEPTKLRHLPITTGIPRVVPGKVPVIWIQSIDDSENETARWQSLLVVDAAEPLIMDGMIHDVAQWGDTLAVLGTRELYFFRMVP